MLDPKDPEFQRLRMVALAAKKAEEVARKALLESPFGHWYDGMGDGDYHRCECGVGFRYSNKGCVACYSPPLPTQETTCSIQKTTVK